MALFNTKKLVCMAAGAALFTGCADESPTPLGTESQTLGLERPAHMVDSGFLVTEPTQGGCIDRRQDPSGSCNNFETKEKVYLALGSDVPDGEYFFAVIDPTMRPWGFLDGADGNLSDTTPTRGATSASGDVLRSRTFTLYRGRIRDFHSTHAVSARDGRPLIQLMPFDDTTDARKTYVAGLCSIDAMRITDCKFDMFRVRDETAVPTPVSGKVYYDANTNGRFDEGEAGISGVTILYLNETDGRLTTDRGGNFVAQLMPDTYTFMQKLMPRPKWMQTGNVFEQWSTEGESRISLNWFRTYEVSVVDERPITGLNFGNVCVGGGGGKLLSFWAGRKGAELVSTADVAKLSEMELKGEGGDFDPSSHAELAKWLEAAPTGNVNMALSAEMAALKLSTLHGFVGEEALVRAQGAHSANVSGFSTVRELLYEVNSVLGEIRPEIRVEERKVMLRRALADANVNRSFVQANEAACRVASE